MNITNFFIILCCCFCLLLLSVDTETKCMQLQREHQTNIGVIVDGSTRVGKEQKIAMEIAVRDFQHCMNLVLNIKDLHGNSSASAAIDLVNHIPVDAILGTITLQEADFISQVNSSFRKIPIVSLSPEPSVPLHRSSTLLPFVHVSSSVTYQTECIAAIVGHFKWRKVVFIHELVNGFLEDSGIFTHLSDSLRPYDASIEHHLAFPRVLSLLDPRKLVENELMMIKSKNVRVFVVAQSSLEFAVILFEKAKELGMLGKGYAWIVSDEIGNFLDSVDPSFVSNSQGIIGLKTYYEDTSRPSREFKSKFRRKYMAEHPAEEENSSPSIYSYYAYDAIWCIFKSSQLNSDGKFDPAMLVSSTDFKGLSGSISFRNGLLSGKPVFQIVNVIGKSYREVARWSPDFGFTEVDGKHMLSIYWPGGEQIAPIGLAVGCKEKPLRIGVPANGAFNQFVKVIHDPSTNHTWIGGFSIEVFKSAVKHLAYDLYYTFIPHYGSYDELVTEVHNKSLDAAVGDTEIMADRYVYAEFSQPYIESGLVLVVTDKPALKNSKFIALNPFSNKMWIQLAGISLSTGSIIWLTEYATGNEQFARNSFLGIIGSILWLSFTIISFSQKEEMRSAASKVVLAGWVCIVFVVAASFTAVLSTMMTVPRLLPSIPSADYLLETNAAVGCNGNSFIVRYLTDVLHFKPENVHKINSFDEYPNAFKTGRIKAAFFVAPHAKVFLAENCRGYTISGPTYKLGGFGFVFPRGSQLAIDISEAVLKVTQSGRINTLEHTLYHSNCSAADGQEEYDGIELGPEPFYGMFEALSGVMGAAFVVAIFDIVKSKWNGIEDLVQRALIKNRICLWASLILIDSCWRSGPHILRETVIQVTVPGENGDTCV